MKWYVAFSTLIMGIVLASCAETGPVRQSPVISDQSSLKRAAEDTRKFFIQQKEMHSQETKDTDWAQAFEKKIRQSYEELPLDEKAVLTKVDCRQSRCTIDIRFDSQEDLFLQQSELIGWLAASQKCGFHIPGGFPLEASKAGALQAYITCTR